LAARVVEVLADLGEGHSPRYRSGSGCIVAGRTVLTAAHVVEGAVSVKVRSPNKVLREAALDAGFVGDVDGPGPDLALVELTGPGVDLPAMGLAAVDRDSVSGDPVERCHAVGYPVFMERHAPDGGRVRETADAFGHVPVLSGLAGGLLSVQVSSAPRPLPPGQTALGQSQWSGMSGAPVVAAGLLLGVVTEHAPRAGDSAITATPLTALEADPARPGWGPGVADPDAWWARLGCSGVDALRRLPARPVRTQPAYWATVRDIHRRTGTLVGRQGELAELACFVAGTDGYRWLAGDAWTGKTSLLAEAVAVMGDQCDVVCYFLSRREAEADSSKFLAAVVPQLAYLLEEAPPVADPHQYRALWQRAARRAEAEDRPLLLVVDGLDEDLHPPRLPSVATLLPPGAGGRIHVLVSSRPHLDLRRDLPPGHALTQTEPVTIRPFEGGNALADLARQEIDDLLRRDDDGLAADVLGLLTAAAGPLAVADLAALSAVAPQSSDITRRIRRLVRVEAARSLQPVGLAMGDRYQFAHGSLLEQAQENEDLSDPDYLRRIHQWADGWQAAGWPPMDGAGHGTPRYLLDTYPSTLTEDPQRLAALAGDADWVTAAIQTLGVDAVLAELKTAVAAAPGEPRLAAMHAVVRGQAHHLRDPETVGDPGFVPRQLCLQATELGETLLAADCQTRQLASGDPGPVLQWTTRRAWPTLILEFGRHESEVGAVAVLPDGRVVTGSGGTGRDGRVLVWDPAEPGAGPVELGRHESGVAAVAVLPDGRVVTGGYDGRVLVWDPAEPGAGPVELGRHEGPVGAVAVLPDGRVVSGGGGDGRVLVWDPVEPDSRPVELGRHGLGVGAVGVLPDRRIVTGGGTAYGGGDGRVLVWDPAEPGSRPVELGRHESAVGAVAVLPDGWAVTGGYDDRVRLWDVQSSSPGTLLACSAYALATSLSPSGARLLISHAAGGISCWEVRPATQNPPGHRQRAGNTMHQHT
jgi:Trypsin-like peptidase domain/WD domain, G-beta repeat